MQGSWTIQFVLTTLVLFVPGIRFYAQGLPALWRLAPDMYTLRQQANAVIDLAQQWVAGFGQPVLVLALAGLAEFGD